MALNFSMVVLKNLFPVKNRPSARILLSFIYFLSKCELHYYNHISLKENPFLELLITLQIYYAAAGLG